MACTKRADQKQEPTYMKRFIALCTMCLVFNYISANHLAGGELYYEFSHKVDSVKSAYNVFLIGFGGVANPILEYSSSCDAGGSIQMSIGQPTGWGPPGPCPIDSILYSRTFWKSTIILNQKCHDWEFKIPAGCCRVNNLTNIHSANASMELKVHLNNTLGENNSPRFIDPPSNGFCLSRTNFIWPQRGTDSDGDSLSYGFGRLAGYFPGYTPDTPMVTKNGIQIDAQNGYFIFQPSQLGLNQIKIDIEEYRFNPLDLNWTLVGSTTREVPVPVYSSCDPKYMNWTVSTGPLGKQDLEPECGEDFIALSVETGFNCNSLDPTDFALYQSDGNVIPIQKAESNCEFGIADSIYLTLQSPLNLNDTLNLVSQIGNDGNTLLGKCGFELVSGDSTRIIVSNCNATVGVPLKMKPELKVFPNPAKNWVELQFPFADEKTIELYSMNGDLLFREKVQSASLKMDLNFLDSGIYSIKIKTKDQVKNVSLIHH